MSQQNFILQINLFMEFGKRNRLTSYERMFWLGLFHFANDLAQQNPNHEWPDDFFTVQNSDLTAWSGLEERNIRSIRNRFKQIGLIDFKKGDGKRGDPEYRLFYMRFNGYKIVPDTVTDSTEDGSIGNKNAPGCVSGSVGDSVPDCVSDTVPDGQGIGGKNAPGCVCDPLTYSRTPNILNNININQGGENVRVRTEAGAETYPVRTRVIGGKNAPGFPQSFPQSAGFADLSKEMDYDGSGLVPLPWDEGAGM